MSLATKTWNAGDVLTAGDLNTYVRDNFLFLAPFYDSTLGADTATFDITSIPGTGTSLELAMFLRTTAAGAGFKVTFNADSADANYDRQRIIGSATTVAAQETLASSGEIDATNSGASANKFTACSLRIPNYADSSNHKVLEVSYALVTGTASGNLTTGTGPVVWHSAAAISQITLTPTGGGSFKAGSRVTLWLK